MVIKLPIGDQKKRTKALKTAAGMEGVKSVEIDADNQLILVGEGTDVVELALLLRKKVGYAEVISVTSAEEKTGTREDDDDKPCPSTTGDYCPNIYNYGVPSPYGYPYPFPHHWHIEYREV
ncbi:hypothetical protein LUZ61_001986 [Rhynchospora tenuis]|uniref:HMA domain-containing protein n=1 Tax=Rhynchospora tenuis TaxID=198213 RepID=A0AAD5ZI11_9POAL|nr:hypothetical protein LUZ61_001986 [Rhynchospora tenuis]